MRSSVVEFTAEQYRLVYSVAVRYMKDEERARDVAQEALLRAFRYRHSFRGESMMHTWLYRIAATTSLMQLRRDRSRKRQAEDSLDELSDDPHHDWLRAIGPSPEEQSVVSAAVSQASDWLALLADEDRTIFAMRFVEGYSDSEVGRELGLTPTVVKSRAFRIRHRLQRQMAEALDR